MDYDLIKNRIREILQTIEEASWLTLENHSPDDLLADAEDFHRISEIARYIAGDLDHYNSYPKQSGTSPVDDYYEGNI